MTKLKYMYKDHLSSGNDATSFDNGFQIGFKQAFKIINEKLNEERKSLEQYPLMGERIQAIVTYQKKINQILEEVS